MYRNQRRDIDGFLGLKRIAMIGISRNEHETSRALFKEMVERGYDVVPVNPNAQEIEGQRCYGSIVEVEPAVEGALVFTPPPTNRGVVKQCLEAHVPRIWLYGAGGGGAASQDVVEMCDREHVPVVAGECPFMFLPQTAWFHRAHGWVREIFGRGPV